MSTTSADLYEAIARKFSPPAWVVMPEVRNATGFSRRIRIADAVAMGMYPSRGLEVHGFEIKVSKSDWRRELKDPGKAEEIARFCDHWWIVAPLDMVDPGDLPMGWGLLVARPNGLYTVKKAPKLEPEPLDRAFVASMLRSAHELVCTAERRSASEKALSDSWKKGYDEGLANGKRENTYRAEEAKKLRQRVSEFKERSGIDLDSYKPVDVLLDTVKFAELLARNSHVLRTLHGAIGKFLERKCDG